MASALGVDKGLITVDSITNGSVIIALSVSGFTSATAATAVALVTSSGIPYQGLGSYTTSATSTKAENPSSSSSSSNGSSGLAAGVGAGVGCLVIILIVGVVIYKRSRNKTSTTDLLPVHLAVQLESVVLSKPSKAVQYSDAEDSLDYMDPFAGEISKPKVSSAPTEPLEYEAFVTSSHSAIMENITYVDISTTYSEPGYEVMAKPDADHRYEYMSNPYVVIEPGFIVLPKISNDPTITSTATSSVVPYNTPEPLASTDMSFGFGFGDDFP